MKQLSNGCIVHRPNKDLQSKVAGTFIFRDIQYPDPQLA